MSAIYVRESYVNATEGHRFGDSEVYESSYQSAGDLYRACVREFGRCTGKVYIDGPNNTPAHVGWTFLGRQQYEDTHEPYLREVWVTMHDAPDTVEVTPHYRLAS